jgi:signal transduction histidine kinase
MKRKRLGELLIEAGFISRKELNHALDEQKISREKLGQILMRLGYITADNFFELYEDLKIISNLIQVVHESSNLREVYRVALESVIELENVDIVMIYLVDEEKHEAVLQAHRNVPEDYVRRAGNIPYPKGLTWKAINSGTIINIEDAQKDPDTGPAGKDLGHHGSLGIPILLEEKVIGVIWFVSYRERKFNEREVNLLSTLGNQIAIAIARAKQNEELEERNRNLSILSTISQAIHQSVDLNQVYKTVLDIIKGLKFIDLMTVYLVEGEGDKREAVLQVHRGYPEEYLKKASRIPYPRGNTWKIIESGESAFYEDASAPSTPVGPAGKALGKRSLLSIPVKSGSEAIGTIDFSSFKKSFFTQQDLDFLLSLGSQIGTAIAKAKMFEEMKQQAQELKALYENLKNTQERLIQSEKLASLGEIISSISHEINNPLTPVIGYSQRLLMQPDLDEKKKQSLEMIYSSAHRVEKIIDKLLSFSRKHKPTREYVDINNIVEKTIEFRAYQLRLGNIEVRKDLDPDLPKTMADPNQLQQVFLNIILNAEQAIDDARGKGQLIVRTRIRQGGIIEVSFIDDGPGIPKEILGKIFDPFFTTKAVDGGSGLGLSVSYGIIKGHSGEIYALSREGGKGAILKIELPILKEEVIITKEAKISRIPTVGKKRVLVVEDEATINNMIKDILEEERYQVDSASNGEEALAKININSYDVIICDIKMPYMDGKLFYNEIITKKNSLTDRFIFITGDSSSQTVDFINQTGNRFLAKPFRIEEFKKVFYAVLPQV